MATDVKNLVAQMTLEEKASLLGGGDFWHTKGIERLGISKFMLSDGPHGLRKQSQDGDCLGINDSIKSVCFPAACATASSFDTELMYRIGETIGEECQAEDVAIVLGPAVNIKRSPLCGRNFEYFSEDPYLSGKLAAAYIKGVQSKHVGTSIKHFVMNNQETRRMSISADADERTMREIYLPAFEIAVKEAQPKTVMCSYNKINHVYSAENKWLLTDVLRKEWGFEGFVMTDWGAVSDRVEGVRAGLELEMPGDTSQNDAKIVKAVQTGKLDEAAVDEACERILTVLYDYYDNRKDNAVFDRNEDHKIAVEAEEECAVLLENNGILPLKKEASVVYIGEYAEKPRYQGGGSSHINAYKVSSALQTAKESDRNVTYVKGFSADGSGIDEMEMEKAVQVAEQADIAVIFAGLPDAVESEGFDRKNMQLPDDQNTLIEKVLSVQPNTVVVLHNGSPIEVPWAKKAAAILEMYLGGQGVGEATDHILFGETNPSGHLAETFPYRLEDNPSYLNFPGDEKSVRYSEGVYVGYRYYEKKKIPVCWAFGHGLTYTKFEISNLKVSEDHMNESDTILVSADVKNIGTRYGKEVVQLYISDQGKMPGRPVKELKGFAKVGLNPGEKDTVSFSLTGRDFAYFEERIHDWYAPSGEYAVMVGSASDEIAEQKTIQFTTDRNLLQSVAGDTTVGELLKDSRTLPVIMGLMKKFEHVAASYSGEGEGLGEGESQMNQAMMEYMPLKSIPSFVPMSDEQYTALIAMFQEAIEQENGGKSDVRKES